MNRTLSAYKGYAMRGETYIYFNGQFWIGLFTEECDGAIVRVGRYLFGNEPSLTELDTWMHQGFPGLVMLMPPKEGLVEAKKTTKKNPKRALREIRRESKKPKDIREYHLI